MVAKLPIFQTPSRDLNMLQTTWASALNPVLGKPWNEGLALKGVLLTVGVNNINHLLGRKQQGWVVTDIDGITTLYRSAPLNDLTLVLTSSAAVTVDLLVF